MSPVRLGKKRYSTFNKAKAAVQKTKGLSEERAAAYVAATERLIEKRRKAKRARNR